MFLRGVIFSTLAFTASSAAATHCKTSPKDATWPSVQEWGALNRTLHGALIKTIPTASSCYAGNPFGSPENCSVVNEHWTYAASHAAWPESVDYPFFANNSCLPPSAGTYNPSQGCSIGGLPQYIVNAKTDQQIATAMRWASQRQIRIVVKGTGHDLSGRSTGAYALSIWTHNLNHVEHHPAWGIPGSEETADVLICGSGNNWGSIYTAAHGIKRTVVGGEDATVGPGGLIRNGGHGLLSSHYGLASDQVYQVTVITTEGHRLVANRKQNQDLFWAVCGSGGQFGVVTEFVLKTHPVPVNIVTGEMSFSPRDSSAASANASWYGIAQVISLIPDLMDAGLTGNIVSMAADSAMANQATNRTGMTMSVNLIGYNTTATNMNTTLHFLSSKVSEISHGKVNFTFQQPTVKSYWEYTKPDPLTSTTAGGGSLLTSRLMGREELSDIHIDRLVHYLQAISVTQDTSSGAGMLILGLQGGPGPASVPKEMRKSVLPAWRTAYVHLMAYGASLNQTLTPSKALAQGTHWIDTVQEPVWRDWAPKMGSYMNEGNVFSSTWKVDFYGENYDRLVEIKQKYDPSESLFAWAGVGSDMWRYDLQTGLLCRAASD